MDKRTDKASYRAACPHLKLSALLGIHLKLKTDPLGLFDGLIPFPIGRGILTNAIALVSLLWLDRFVTYLFPSVSVNCPRSSCNFALKLNHLNWKLFLSFRSASLYSFIHPTPLFACHLFSCLFTISRHYPSAPRT